MWFEIDADGIKVKLQITGYTPANKDNWDSEWCKCDFLFSSGEWLNYHKENDEVLLCCEIEELAESLTDLIDDKLSGDKEIICIEPDFIFKLYPKKHLRENPNYTYIQPGCEIQDAYLEWKIYFWNEGLTNNYLTVTLDRDNMVKFRDYLTFWISK